jgi:acyl-CoA thioesterase-1
MEPVIRRLATAPMTRIVALGSSSTERAHHSEGSHNWADWLDVGLRARYGRVHHTINAGVSGETARQMLGRFDRDVAHYRPQVVMMMAGGNDCNPVNEITPALFREDLRELVGRVRSLGDCHSILQTYYSFDTDSMQEEEERARQFPLYMEIVREVAREEGVVLFDHLARWERLRLREPHLYQTLMRDAMHVNPLGNMVIGLDVLRRFGAEVTGETAAHCAEGLEAQRVLDRLEEEEGTAAA